MDLERIRLSTPVPQPNGGNRRSHFARVRGKFLKGPISLNWLSTAAHLPGKTLHVGLALWFLVGLKRSGTVKLGSSTLKLFGIDRKAGYSALRRLEDARLVNVSRGIGRNPVVTIVEVEEV